MPEAPARDHRIVLLATFALTLGLAGARSAEAQTAPPLGYIERPTDPAAPLAYPTHSSATASSDRTTPPPLEPDPEVAVDLALAAEMPLMLGGQATLEVPYRFLFQGEVGVLPGFSIDAVDSALVGSGAYDATTSELVRNTLRDSLVMRLSAGWRPFPDHGLELLGGYTLVSLGGDVSARQAVESIAGVTVPAEIPDAQIAIHSTVHSVHFGLGWRWVVADHFLVRMSLGYMQAVSSSSHLEVPAELAGNATVTNGAAVANGLIDAKLNEIYTTYVKLPVAGLSMGYRF